MHAVLLAEAMMTCASCQQLAVLQKQGHCSCVLSDLLCGGLHVLHVVHHRDMTDLSALCMLFYQLLSVDSPCESGLSLSCELSSVAAMMSLKDIKCMSID